MCPRGAYHKPVSHSPLIPKQRSFTPQGLSAPCHQVRVTAVPPSPDKAQKKPPQPQGVAAPLYKRKQQVHSQSVGNEGDDNGIRVGVGFLSPISHKAFNPRPDGTFCPLLPPPKQDLCPWIYPTAPHRDGEMCLGTILRAALEPSLALPQLSGSGTLPGPGLTSCRLWLSRLGDTSSNLGFWSSLPNSRRWTEASEKPSLTPPSCTITGSAPPLA